MTFLHREVHYASLVNSNFVHSCGGACSIYRFLILGGRLQKKANSQQEALASAAQTVSMLIIDKKKLKITEANLPKVVTDQVPKYARRAKFPI